MSLNLFLLPRAVASSLYHGDLHLVREAWHQRRRGHRVESLGLEGPADIAFAFTCLDEAEAHRVGASRQGARRDAKAFAYTAGMQFMRERASPSGAASSSPTTGAASSSPGVAQRVARQVPAQRVARQAQRVAHHAHSSCTGAARSSLKVQGKGWIPNCAAAPWLVATRSADQREESRGWMPVEGEGTCRLLLRQAARDCGTRPGMGGGPSRR